MPCSTAQLAANRANAQQSTGPTSEAGKARSRANALQHGLTGAAVAVPGEDVALIDHRFAAITRELNPRGELALHLTRRVAALSIRLERSVRHESASIAERVRHAYQAFDLALEDEADRLIDRLAVEPVIARRHLEQTPAGCDRLIAAFRGLRDELRPDPSTPARSHWSAAHGAKLDELLGRRPTDFPRSRGDALTRALAGDPSGLDPGAAAGLDDEAARLQVLDALTGLIDEQVERLQAQLATLDLAAIELDRREAAERALFDPAPAAALARKYELATERQLFRTLRAIQEINRAADSGLAPAAPLEPRSTQTGRPEPVATQPAFAPARPLGSFWPHRVDQDSRPPAFPFDPPLEASRRPEPTGFAQIVVGKSVSPPARV